MGEGAITQSQQKLALQQLVASALRQLTDSQSDLERRPDRSLVSFYIGLELALKARLFDEHWALVLTDPGSHSLADLTKGNAATLGLDDCMQRLITAAGVHFSRPEKSAYSAVRKHRNRVVHFYHDAHAPASDTSTRLSVLIEQCRAWTFLRQRLVNDWRPTFAMVQPDIARLDSAFRRNRTYLAARHEDLKPRIEERRAANVVFVPCATCEYTAAQIDPSESPPLLSCKCLVCDSTDMLIRTSCPECSEPLMLRESLCGACERCGYTADVSIAAHVSDEARGFALSPKELMLETEIACSTCELPSVATIGNQFLCCSCFTWGDRIDSCGYCGQAVMDWDASEGSHFLGCCMCDGAPLDKD